MWARRVARKKKLKSMIAGPGVKPPGAESSRYEPLEIDRGREKGGKRGTGGGLSMDNTWARLSGSVMCL